MSWWQFLLFPFAIIYDLVTRCRNWLYDIGVFSVHVFDDLKIISVGNLSVGGTGKTPMVEYLIRWALAQNIPTAILSRGYGRKTKGVLIASEDSNAVEIGDESYSYQKLFGEKVAIVVAENRVEGIQEIKSHLPKVQLVILDDAFQHRRLKSDFNILLTTSGRPFWRDYVLPAGLLREARRGFKRSDFLIVTKMDDHVAVPNGINKTLAKTRIKYGQPIQKNGSLCKKVYGVAGLASNEYFFDFLDNQFELTGTSTYKDHHAYVKEDIENIIKDSEGATLLCTSKDAVKLQNFDELKQKSWGYVPIEVEFVEGEEGFLQMLKKVINE